jgi:hypothetical protein
VCLVVDGVGHGAGHGELARPGLAAGQTRDDSTQGLLRLVRPAHRPRLPHGCDVPVAIGSPKAMSSTEQMSPIWNIHSPDLRW